MPIQIIEQGPRNLVVKVDGPTSQMVDVTTLVPPCEELRLMEVQYNTPSADTTAVIEWDAASPEIAWSMANHEGKQCFDHFGGIPNNAGAGKTGNVLINPGDGVAVVRFKKVNPVIPL